MLAIVTGASRGLGRLCARELAAHGVNLLLVARNQTALADVAVETKMKYRHTIDPLKSEKKDDTVLVTCRLSGEFPGSPIEAQFAFVLHGGKISSLEIR